MPLKILCSGYLVRSPLGGLSWHHLQYLVGLERLGHQVTFFEDYGWSQSCFDPARRGNTSDPRGGIENLKASLDRFDVQANWCYLAEDGTAYGMSRQQLHASCRECDLYINLSNINWIPELEACPRRVLIDTDPVFTQLGVQGGTDRFDRYHHRFTFGENLGRAGCTMPTGDTTWLRTRQPVVLDLWNAPGSGRLTGPFTTIGTWKPLRLTATQARQYGQKDRQFPPYFQLPHDTGVPMEIAMNPPPSVRRDLIAGGWHVVDPLDVAATPDDYQTYLSRSRGEFSVAKHGYVATRCGWFSERSACYLASGLPVVVEDTGFTEWLPTGLGVVAFRNKDEAAAGLESVSCNYPQHCQAAREIATEYFDSTLVLSALLDTAMQGPSHSES